MLSLPLYRSPKWELMVLMLEMHELVDEDVVDQANG